MAKFEGVKWANQQMRYLLGTKAFALLEPDSKVYAVSRSIHYGLFLVFEGIRFFCKKSANGRIEVNFLNLEKNLTRFQRGIAFNLASSQQHQVPSVEVLKDLFVDRFLKAPEMRSFMNEMADLKAQGYLRPFTVDEEQSIGVTFPNLPAIRAVVCRYDYYLGEPFSGVVVPGLVRAVGVNGTGCLKLGINYLLSVRAVDEAKKILPEAAAALFLDDRPQLRLEDRTITEWDSSCCLIALHDGTVIKIPESNLILPSVTIAGMAAILRQMGVTVEERDMRYGELIELVKANKVVTVCSIGTAGILNRCDKLLLVDLAGKTLATQVADKKHPLYETLVQARTYYWDIYQEKVPVPVGLKLDKYTLD